MSLWCIRFWQKQKTKAVRVIGQYRTLLITVVSAIPHAEKHCHHLKKKATLKFPNDTEIMCSKAISIRSTEFDAPPPQNMMTNNNKTLLFKKTKALSQNCRQYLQSSKTCRITNRQREQKANTGSLWQHFKRNRGPRKAPAFCGRRGTVEWVIFRAFARKWAICNLWRREAG